MDFRKIQERVGTKLFRYRTKFMILSFISFVILPFLVEKRMANIIGSFMYTLYVLSVQHMLYQYDRKHERIFVLILLVYIWVRTIGLFFFWRIMSA